MQSRLRPFYLRGCHLTGACARTAIVAHSANRTNSLHRPRASLRDRVSKTQSAWGSTKAACQFSWGRGSQAMHLPCKQADAGALPADSTSLRRPHQRAAKAAAPKRSAGGLHMACRKSGYGSASQIQLRETRLKYREKPHKLLQVGVIPTPATNIYGKCSGCRSVKPVSSNKPEATTGALPAFPTNLRQGFGLAGHFGLVAQSAEQPVVCGKAEGANHFGSAIFRSVAQSLERPAWDREAAGGNPAVPTNFRIAAVVEYIRHPPSKRNDAGESPAGSAIARWCQSSTTVC